jgi:hypothetical protein
MALGLMVAVTVAVVTGRMSWFHIVHVGVMVGEPDARLLPVPVDGMMLTGTVMIGVDRLMGREARIWATIGLWVGASFTLSMNVASAWERGWWARLVALVPAITLVITVETIFRPSRRVLRMLREAVEVAIAPTVAVAAMLPTFAPEPVTVTPEPTPLVEPETPVVEPEPVAESVTVKAPRRRGGGAPRGPRVKRLPVIEETPEESTTVESEPPMVAEVMTGPVDTDRPAVPVAAFIAA